MTPAHASGDERPPVRGWPRPFLRADKVKESGRGVLAEPAVNARARNRSFRKHVLEGIDFQGADLAGCDRRDAVLLDRNLRDANLSQARFEGRTQDARTWAPFAWRTLAGSKARSFPKLRRPYC